MPSGRDNAPPARRGTPSSRRAWRRSLRLRRSAPLAPLIRLDDVDAAAGGAHPTGIGELDRVLGGGLVAGSVTLLGGEPGIGKSTLVLQLLARRQGPTLYVSAEESPEQVKGRAQRLGCTLPEGWIAGETALGRVVAAIDRVQPELVVIDSIQTISDERVAAAPGSATQVRDVRATVGGRGEAARLSPSSSSATSPRTARSPDRASSSTQSTRCSRSRANATTRCACSVPSSIASGRRVSSDCSR